jgi:sulfur-carrier protein adenylyltransferase/sulfurtransferase
VAEAKAETEHVDVGTVHDALGSGENVIVVKVRMPDEYEVEHIPQAKLIPRGTLEERAPEQLPDEDARIFTHCGAGGRSSLSAKSLEEMGYSNVDSYSGP